MQKPLRLLAVTSLLCASFVHAQTSDDPNPDPNRTTGFVAASNGNSFIAIAGQNKIYRLDPDGFLTVYAGTGEAGFNGENVASTDAQLSAPWGLYLDSAGNLFFADRGNSRLRKVDAGTGVITTVAGTGTAGFEGDGGLATDAQLNSPMSVAADAAGNLVMVDAKDARIRTVALDSGLMSSIPVEEGAIPLSKPYAVANDADGALFVTDGTGVLKLTSGSLKKAAIETVTVGPSGVFYAPSVRQVAYPNTPLPVPMVDWAASGCPPPGTNAGSQDCARTAGTAVVNWAPVVCPAPGTNPGSSECSAAARLLVNFRRAPGTTTLEVKSYEPSDTIAVWTIEDIQFVTLTGSGAVALVDTALPIVLNTAGLPVPLNVDIPISAVRVGMTVTGSVQINTANYPFSLTAHLFP